MVKYLVDYDEDKNMHEIPLLDDWIMESKSLGWEVWAHDPSGNSGVVEYGRTKGEALERLKARMAAWIMHEVEL